MIILFKLIFITSIIVLAWKVAISEDMIFEKIGDWAESKTEEGKKGFELLYCQWCMPSVWSSVGFFFAWATGIVVFDSLRMLIYYPLCVCGSCVFCGFVWDGYLTMNQFKENNEAQCKRNRVQEKYYNNVEQLTHFEIKNKKEEYKSR